MRPPRSALRPGTLALALASASLAGCPLVAMVGTFQSLDAYRPGHLLAREHGHRLGCVEITASLYEASMPMPRIEFEFGNRCDQATPLALDAARVWLRNGDARADRALVADDPNREIRPLPLEARTSGREVIAYRKPATPGAPDTPQAEPAREICVDLSGVARGGSAAPDCFALPAPAPPPPPPRWARPRTPIPPGPTLFDDPALDGVLAQLARSHP